MNILFLANLIPYPADNGGKIKTLTDLRILSSEHTVDFISFYEHEDIDQGENELSKYCRSITLIPIRVTTRENMRLMMRKAFCSLFSQYSLGIYKYISNEMKKALMKHLGNKGYDYVYCNILAMYAYASLIKKYQPHIKILLAEQNCEALIYGRMKNETNGLIKKLFLSLEYKKLSSFEYKAVDNADKVIVLSEADKKELEKQCNKSLNCEIIPIGVPDFKSRESSLEDEKNQFTLLFVGTLTWEPNNAGLIWFLESVIPRIKTNFNMIIVGKNPSERVQNIAKQYKNIQVTGYVESVEPYFDKADCMIVPLFIGSGQRVKIIESFARKMPVISTSIGAEGLGYKDCQNICIANNAEEFVKYIDKMQNKEFADTIAKNARTLFEQQFEESAVAKKMLSILN